MPADNAAPVNLHSRGNRWPWFQLLNLAVIQSANGQPETLLDLQPLTDHCSRERDEPMDDEQLAYLARALRRHRDDAVNSAREGRNQALAQGASKGLGGNVLKQVGREYDDAAKQAGDRMVRHTYELMGSNSAPVTETLEGALRDLCDTLSNELAVFFRSPQCSWAPKNATASVENGFLEAMDRRISATVDDFRFGISGRKKLSNDPIVNMTSSISNSPGAILQSGMGNVQHALTKEFTQTGTEVVARGDFNALSTALRGLEIPQSDVDLLRGAIEADQRTFGARTKEWLMSVGSKIGNAGLKIGSGAATQIVNAWLLQYFDLK